MFKPTTFAGKKIGHLLCPFVFYSQGTYLHKLMPCGNGGYIHTSI